MRSVRCADCLRAVEPDPEAGADPADWRCWKTKRFVDPDEPRLCRRFIPDSVRTLGPPSWLRPRVLELLGEAGAGGLTESAMLRRLSPTWVERYLGAVLLGLHRDRLVESRLAVTARGATECVWRLKS